MIAELETFCAAADLGSLGRAAVRLHVSQPALSKRIHALEARAGTELLRRTPQGVELTEPGRRLYAEAQRLLAQAAVVDDLLAGLRNDRATVRVAASHTAAESFLPTSLSGNLTVELVIANSGVVHHLIADGRADVGIAAASHGRVPAGLREEHLVDDAVAVAVPMDHAWARTRRVSLKEFLRTPMVVRDRSADTRVTVDEVLAERGVVAAPPLCEAGTTVAAKTESRTRRAPVLLSSHALTGHGLIRVEVEGLSFPRTFVIVLPEGGTPAPATRAFVEQLRASVAAHVDLTPEARPDWTP